MKTRTKYTKPNPHRLRALPSLAELEVCPQLILAPPLRPEWALGLAIHRSPQWLEGAEEIAAEFDRLDLAEVSFTLPNAAALGVVRMTFWQFAYLAMIAAGGFTLYVKASSGLPYVHLEASGPSQHPRSQKPRRYHSTAPRLLEDAKRGEVVAYLTSDRLDLRPHAIKKGRGPGNEDTKAAVMGHVRRKLNATKPPGRRRYRQTLDDLHARCQSGSESYRRAHVFAEQLRRGHRANETPFICLSNDSATA